MAIHRTCDGLTRRDAIRIGALGCGAIGGLSLSNFMRLAEAGEVSDAKSKAAIFISLPGGPSHLDTFDMKPDAPSEFRGTFNPIKTNVPGIEFCEHLPQLAKCADKFAILRGVSHTLGAHQLGQEYVNTGNRPLPSLEYPGIGAVVNKELEGEKDLPPFVAIPNSTQSGGYLGVQYSPLQTNAVPRVGQPFGVRGISLTGGLTIDDIERRHNLLKDLDQTFKGIEKEDQLLSGLDRFSQQAYDVITSRRARLAFDISKENPEFASPYGEQPFGLSCLLATRLVESGIKFVTVTLGGWDTHQNNFSRLKDGLLPNLDTGLSALFNGLEQKGLLESTTVYVTGEFGRTPKINDRSEEGGRDHYPRCMFMLMGGGPVCGGQVIGESDAKAAMPANEAISPDDVTASFFDTLGIDPTREYHTATGRPVMIVRNGKIIKQLTTG
ncbi:DUF1501 domain-containing protein [Vicingaceae bacterium]|nr:DUF1501 domain-containing protein [Vicingaceae bacterium]